MNICIATNSYFPNVGGIATYYKNLACMLTSQGHNVHVLMVDYHSTTDTEDLQVSEDKITKIILRRSYCKEYNYYSGYFSPGGFDAPLWISMGIAMRNWLLSNQPTCQFDIIEVSDYGGIGSFLIHPYLPPIVVTAHGSLLQYSKVNHTKKDKHYELLIGFEKNSFTYADAVLSYSPLNREQLLKIFDRKIDFIIAPWIPDNFGQPTNAVTGLPLIIAGLQKIKGAEILPEALDTLVNTGHNISAEWIGGDFFTAPPDGKSMAGYLEQKFAHLWGQHFLWKNEQTRDSTKRSLQNCSFVIIPSLYETFSYVALEAATLGKAIIITQGTGASFLFTDSHNALLIPENNAEKLANAILQLNSSPAYREQLGKNARAMVDSIFDTEKLVAERIRFYTTISANRRAAPDIFTLQINLIKNQLTWVRKLYYAVRKAAKKIIKK